MVCSLRGGQKRMLLRWRRLQGLRYYLKRNCPLNQTTVYNGIETSTGNCFSGNPCYLSRNTNASSLLLPQYVRDSSPISNDQCLQLNNPAVVNLRTLSPRRLLNKWLLGCSILTISSIMALAADSLLYEVGHVHKWSGCAGYMLMGPCNNTGGIGWGMMQ